MYEQNAALAGSAKQASAIELGLKQLEQAVGRLEERYSLMESRLAPVVQNPQLKVARITGTERPPDQPAPPTSLVAAQLRTMTLRVDATADRLEALIRSLDV